MQSMIEYVDHNKQWIFSGVGVAVLMGLAHILRRVLRPLSGRQGNSSNARVAKSAKTESDHWQGMRPPNSRYETVTESTTSMPAGIQTCSFEYGPHGHVHPVVLSGRPARLEIQFTCQVTNPYKALFEANEYALNVLPPKFLQEARTILERHTVAGIRRNRQQIADVIKTACTPLFEKFGMRLDSVTIGAVDKIGGSKTP